MGALVATERHLWLSQSSLKEKDKSFLLDAPFSPSSLFGGGISAVADKLHAERRQAAALDLSLPHRCHVRGAARGQLASVSRYVYPLADAGPQHGTLRRGLHTAGRV
ncbi:uncharacterized protein ACO6RY_11959 [Pungitius sinensis]